MSSKSDIDYKNTHFEYPELSRIHGEPTTANLITLQREIRANAITVHTTLGGGHHGHLGLVCPAATYSTIPNTEPYARPNAPGPLTIGQNLTQYQIAQAREQHAERTRLFREILAVERTIIQQIVAALDAKYLKALRDSVTNKITRTIPEILEHLFNAYGHVTPSELYELKHKVENMQFSPTEPVDTLITEIDDLADIADLAGSSLTDRQRVDIGYIVLQRSKPFKNSLRDWNARPANQRTYANFKTHFRDAQIALRKTGEITVEEGLNHAEVVNMVTEGVRAAFAENTTVEVANNMDETAELRKQVDDMRALIEQMNATQQPTRQPASQNQYNAPRMPVSQNQFNTPQMPFYQAPYNHQPFMYPNMYNQHGYQFQQNWNNNNNNRGGRGGRGRGRGGRGGRGGRRERRYCWTHGLQAHSGRDCQTPMEGRQPDATLENRMGGNTRGVHA